MSRHPALRPDRTVGEALAAVAQAILADARAAIADPSRSDAEAVHDFRREMKRWRALLRLIGPMLGQDGLQLRTAARDLARTLGGARDPQAALDALDDLADHGLALSARSLATVRGRIETIRQAAETIALTPDMRLMLTRALDDAEAAIAAWQLKSVTYAQLADRFARGFRAARRMRPRDWAQAEPEELHELRKRVVNHRYQMELVAPLWPRFGRMWTAEAQRLRERLGKHQDLSVLARFTAPHQPLAAWRSRLAPAIAERQTAHVAAARRMATRLFVDKPAAFRRRLEVMWETGEPP